MRPEIAAVDSASGWREYYQAYSISIARCLHGDGSRPRISGRSHHHHRNFPNVSDKCQAASHGRLFTTSAETLIRVFLGVFRELIGRSRTARPRIATCFFCLKHPLPTRNSTFALRLQSVRLLYSVECLEEQLGSPTGYRRSFRRLRCTASEHIRVR